MTNRHVIGVFLDTPIAVEDAEIQMPQAEAELVIQAFAFHAADPRLGVTIRDGCQERRLDRAAIFALGQCLL